MPPFALARLVLIPEFEIVKRKFRPYMNSKLIVLLCLLVVNLISFLSYIVDWGFQLSFSPWGRFGFAPSLSSSFPHFKPLSIFTIYVPPCPLVFLSSYSTITFLWLPFHVPIIHRRVLSMSHFAAYLDFSKSDESESEMVQSFIERANVATTISGGPTIITPSDVVEDDASSEISSSCSSQVSSSAEVIRLQAEGTFISPDN